MNNEELRQINTLDRYDADLNDWEAALENVRALIDLAENTGDPDAYTGARKQITGVLNEIEQARHFVSVKRAAVEELISDVWTLFDAYPQVKLLDELSRGRHLQDGDRPG